MAAAWQMVCKGLQAGAVEVLIRRPHQKRSQDQNRKLWPMLTDLSRQLEWTVNGVTQQLEPEDWKDLMTNAMETEQRMAPGVNGGFVMLGRRTSRMTKTEFSDLIEVIYAFGSQKGVQWSEPALAVYEQYREAAA